MVIFLTQAHLPRAVVFFVQQALTVQGELKQLVLLGLINLPVVHQLAVLLAQLDHSVLQAHPRHPHVLLIILQLPQHNHLRAVIYAQ